MLSSLVLLADLSSAAPVAALEPVAVVVSGEAPDDGPGFRVIVGNASASADRCVAAFGEHVELGFATTVSAPTTLAIGTPLAEAIACPASGACEDPSSGFVQLEAIGRAGVRGRYQLAVGGRTVERSFEAAWCGEPVTVGVARAPVSVAGFDPGTHGVGVVSLVGHLVVRDGVAVLASVLNETWPPRPAGTVVRLVADAALLDAVTERWSDRVRGAEGPVAVVGQVRDGVVHVRSVTDERR